MARTRARTQFFIHVVSLDWCHNLSNRSLEALAKNCPNLCEFATTECGEFSLSGFKALLAGCQKLENIELAECRRVDDPWIDALIDSKCPIKELNITGCQRVSGGALIRLLNHFKGIKVQHEMIIPT